MSLFSKPSYAKEVNVKLGEGCETATQFMMMVPGVYLYRIGAQGAAAVWSAAAPYAAQGTSTDRMICDAFESFLEGEIRSGNKIDAEKFLEENCNGEYGACDDPLLDVTGCGMFHACPQSPYDCEFNTYRCVDSMINLSDGYTISELTNALIYITTSYNQGYWPHNYVRDNNISFDLQ